MRHTCDNSPTMHFPDLEAPFRGELFSIDRLRSHAVDLATSLNGPSKRVTNRRFFLRFHQNAQKLRRAYRRISQAIQDGEPLTPDAEWLLDNFYVVEEHLREIQEDLPPAYFRELPKAANGNPRILHLAEELIVHTDSVVQQDDLTAFVQEFQSVSPLSIGELWALPIMLRLSLVENLRRLADQLLANLTCRSAIRQQVGDWEPGQPLPEIFPADHPDTAIVAHAFELSGDLFPEDPGRSSAFEQLLIERFSASVELIRTEHRRQAANHVSIGNVITSMRLISALDWTNFFEVTSLAERMLRADPAGIYPLMDPETRDRYRHAVEELAKHSAHSELAVIDSALANAEVAKQSGRQLPVMSHVGYWLIDSGRSDLERELKYRVGGLRGLQQWMRAHPSATYFGSMATIGLCCLLGAAWTVNVTDLSWPVACVMLILSLIPSSELAVSLVNLLLTHILPPRVLPKLELSEGVPEASRTFVVIPSMLTGHKEVAALLDRLELHYVSNPEPQLRFALLTDFADSSSESAESDKDLIEQARAGIRRLNATYGGTGNQPFYLFHRARKWNDKEQVWMGWERKRGKLMEFNRLLHGAQDTSYTVQEGDLSIFETASSEPAVPFIITLDADTQFPLGAARRLIGTMSHPLNRPLLSAQGTCVDHGYSILQPRVGVHLQDGNKSRYTQLFANGKGVDPYATAASDIYQDLFGEGSFTGKGIYDVRTFEQTLADAFGENQILSHDLIEGCHARVGLVSDIEVIDGYPARYDADARRNHRWVRGDWQILPWLFPTVPSQHGFRPNRLSLLSRWKILDNLRRSLVAPATCMLLVASWFLTPHFAAIWSLLAGMCIGWPILAVVLHGILGIPRPVMWKAHLISMGNDLFRAILQTIVLAACLPHKAYLMLDAISRTLFRLGVSRRRMLEWETAADTERRLAKSPISIIRQLAAFPAIAMAIALLLPRAAWPAAAPWLLAWGLSPWIAHFISLPRKIKLPELSVDDRQWLRFIARNTWSYFENFVGPKTNWLPPDNLQEYPEAKLAERISPTNEGFFLVSALVARDFGFIGLHALVDLWEKNLSNWQRLPQLHGHFYNWYETSTLQPLHPRYVSTVDSGNLAASLLVLRQGVIDVCRSPVYGDDLWVGLRDTLSAAALSCEQLQPRGARLVSPPLDHLISLLQDFLNRLERTPKSWQEHQALVSELGSFRQELSQRLKALVAAHRHPTMDVERKIASLELWIENLEQDGLKLTPWLQDYLALSNRGRNQTVASDWKTAWHRLQLKVEAAQTLDQISSLPLDLNDEFASLHAALDMRTPGAGDEESIKRQLAAYQVSLERGAAGAVELKSRLEALGQLAEHLALNMEFEFLYNPQRRLFSIGFNLEDGLLDRSHYDMLCSEARLSSHLAIAKGDVAYKHWFQLGRQQTFTAGQPGLLSWGGTMFEFLMPLLFQRCIANSLISQACEAAVARQQEYGRQRRVPWGVSESAFSALAGNSDYCYQSFGVPGLGLKRGLSDDLVIAPYATMLALSIAPVAAVANLRVLTEEGGLGSLGFYDAVDYTPRRLPTGRRSVPVRNYMAHHQAMSLMAIANVLLNSTVERRFHAHSLIRATEMLLEESFPKTAPVTQPHEAETALVQPVKPEDVVVSRRLVGFETAIPQTHLLSNGTYSVMMTNTGGGYSRRGETGVNRWRPDAANDFGGQWIYIRDKRTGQVWSATYQPTCKTPDAYEVIYSIDKAEYRRRDGDIETHLEIVVSPDCNVEVRQLKITNHGWRPCELEVTSSVEVTLISQAADAAHPAFQKLFIETEYIAEETSLLAKRRPRSGHEAPIWGVHVLACPDAAHKLVQYESCRETFLGRGRDSRAPAALDRDVRLSGTVGPVLDALLALRCTVVVGRNSTASLAFSTGIADSREEALRYADQFHEQRNVHRAFELAWVFNQVQLHHQHMTAAHAQRCQKLTTLFLFPQAFARGPESSLKRNRQGQSALWRYGISGDRPILLVKASEPEHIQFVRELLLAREYWQHRGLDVDLVVLNTHPGSYLDELHEQMQQAVHDSPRRAADARQTVFLLRAAHIPQEDQWLLEAAAHVVMDAKRGWSVGQPDYPAPAHQIRNGKPRPRSEGSLTAARWYEQRTRSTAAKPVDVNDAAVEKLEFWNGWGGFADDGREYHIRLASTARTPAPWSNIIANPRFGCLVTEAGGGYTWAGNSRQNKLTTWSNDPVTDPPSEILYLTDDDSRDTWLPLNSPPDSADGGWVHHGQGFSRFVRSRRDIDVEVLISIAPDDPVKFVWVNLHNRGSTPRRLSATYYAELVMGVSRDQSQMHLVSSVDENTGALLVQNSYHSVYADQVVYLRALQTDCSVTGDRTDFLGRNGHWTQPAALQHEVLSGKTGAGRDPCGAVRSRCALNAGDTKALVFLQGCGADSNELSALLERYATLASVRQAIAQTVARWESVLTKVQIRTPNRAMDLLVNRWLLYQVLSCRLWGRTAFYQCGGAYGFRDQLQDVMALVYTRPDLAREHLLRAASRQFEAGDVQHWWHPPIGEGTRTRFSDDFLWLPFVVAHYLRITGDDAVLDEVVPYLQSPPLQPEEVERYELPQVSLETGSLYEHCLRAIQHGVRLGEHGLPLIGCGDWNDGMSQVGILGRGESVWVGWFLLVLLDQLIPTIKRRGDLSTAELYRQIAVGLRTALETKAWDGHWYRRAFFDDGTPLGSSENDECQIDSIVQSWAVLAEADSSRTDQALAAVIEKLVSAEHQLVALFAPPFDKTSLEPGYIKGYLAGVRENGGQYTHAVAWLIQALTVKGEADRALQIFDYVNPILHAQTVSQAELYRTEPYVIAADVYSMPPHAGRGGWTWYTGSASWIYRVALESILGFTLQNQQLEFHPCVPEDWDQFQVTVRVGTAKWHFSVELYDGPDEASHGDHGLNGLAPDSAAITMNDDGREHHHVIRWKRRGTNAASRSSPQSHKHQPIGQLRPA